MTTGASGTTTLVLASGGLDSSTLLALSKKSDPNVTALFIDYGQAAAAAELEAIYSVSTTLALSAKIVRYQGRTFGAGEIRGRNAFLLHVALLELGLASGSVLIGIHAGTPYWDCSAEFVEVMQKTFDLHTKGRVRIGAPFIDWNKADIHALAIDLGVPIDRTYSCEAASTPCGNCNSCLDRLALNLG